MQTDLPSKRCLDCSYIIDGLPENRCPECGRVFDPDDRRSYRRGARQPRWVLWIGPPRLWSLVAAVVLMTLVLKARSQHACDDVMVMVGAWLIGLVAAADYLMRLLRVRCPRHGPPGGQTGSRGRWRWLVPPLCALLIPSAMLSYWPLRVRFALSRPTFDTVVQGIQDGSHSNLGRQTVGLYSIDFIQQDRGRIILSTGCNIVGPVGMVYAPNDSPLPDTIAIRLAPCWYAAQWH